MNYTELFHSMHPDFFQQEYIRSMPEEEVFAEQIMMLEAFDKEALAIDCPEEITFGLAKCIDRKLKEPVALVDEDWVQYFGEDSPVFCAFDGDDIVSFCILDDMGWHQGLHIGGPGCVGTIPAYRKKGIGLKMVQLATQYLKEQGYHASYIHYTHVDHWYARLGYETIVKWNRGGIVWAKNEA